MKNLMKTAIAAAVTGMLVSPLVMATEQTLDLNLEAHIKERQIELEEVRALNFGSFFVTDAGTIVLSANAGEDVTLNDTDHGSNFAAHDGDASSGQFTITSNIDGTVTVSFPATADLTGEGGDGTNTMTVTLDVERGDTDATLTTGDGVPVANGVAFNINVGGSLAFVADQNPGDYEGDVTFTVDYQ